MSSQTISEEPQLTRVNEENGITLLALLKIIVKHIFIAIITFLVVVGLSVVYLIVTPQKYTSSAKLFVTYSDSNSSADNYSNINSASSYIMSQIKSYPALVTTSAVLQPVIKDLGLEQSVSSLASMISVSNPTNTAFIDISVEEENPREATVIANAVAESLSNVVESSLYPGESHSPVKVTVVQKAVQPTAPSSPKVTITILAGILMGIILGVIAALLRDILSTKISDENQVKDYLDAPIIGRVPTDEILTEPRPVVVSEPSSPIAEDFRRIRTNLSFISPVEGTDSRLIIVTSVGASEGKTTVSANTAAALAENGKSVLLIDADLRHPSVAKQLGLDGSAGLTHVLTRQAAVKDVVQPYWKNNLHIMPAGPKPPNASTLLNSELMKNLVEHALQQYDYVIIDTAPMVVANDAAVFTRLGGGMALVVRRGQTRKHDMRDTVTELNNMNIEVSGLIFNCAEVNKKALEKSSYYYYAKGGKDPKHEANESSKKSRLFKNK